MHEDSIDVSSATVSKLYYEVRPKRQKTENELIKEILDKYNHLEFYLAQHYSNDSNYYFIGLPSFIDRAKTLQHLFIDGTFRVVPISLSLIHI